MEKLYHDLKFQNGLQTHVKSPNTFNQSIRLRCNKRRETFAYQDSLALYQSFKPRPRVLWGSRPLGAASGCFDKVGEAGEKTQRERSSRNLVELAEKFSMLHPCMYSKFLINIGNSESTHEKLCVRQ